MFSLVVMAKHDRRYHRFLLRGLDLTKPTDVYEAMRLLFGDRASPYLAQCIVRQHTEHVDDYPVAVALILLQMHMDDMMASLKTDDEAIKVRDQLIELLSIAGIKILRYCSNSSDVIAEYHWKTVFPMLTLKCHNCRP